ncbi:hypothetical protein RHDC4_01657 [Rhodocyclaceae bacterium]|nr:hypothetical protein RHDC4_01657 [Rhodocyclaceae bacterium]
MKTNKPSVLTVAGVAVVAAAALSPAARAADNPFAVQKLASGYQLAQADTKAKDGSCGGKKAEAKCGADKKMEAKCGADKKAEAKCGADRKAPEKKKDGKCGEAKCGANKK